MPNNIVLNPQRGDNIALTGVSSAYRQPNAFALLGQTVYTTASIPGNAANALYGKGLTISGFAAAGNNGTFVVLASTATTITVNNASGVVVSAAGLASFQTTGAPGQYASKIENIWSNQNGDSVTVNANAGDTLIAVVIGLKQIVEFDQLHGTAPYFPQFGNSAGTIGNYPNGGFPFGELAGLNDFNANPTVSDFSGGAPVDISASSLAGGTLTVSYINPGTSAYFTTGETVAISGTDQAWLNGSIVTVLAGSTASKFTATAGFTAPTLSLSQSDGAFALPGGQKATTYIGTITNGANDAYAGTTFTVANFTTSANNGSFVCLNSTATSLTLLNSGGVAETHSAVAASLAITEGASVVHATAATAGTGGNAVSVAIDNTTAAAPSVVGNAITLHTSGSTVAAYIGAHPTVTVTFGVINFTFTGAGTDTFTTAGAASLAGGINGATALVTAYSNAADAGEATPGSGNTWTLPSNSNIIGSDYTVAYPFAGPLANGTVTPSKPGPSGGPAVPTSNLPTVLTPSNSYQSAKWNLDGYYPSVYVFVASNVVAGSYKINLNSMYQPGSGAVSNKWSQGAVPIFDGGVQFQVFNFSGAATSSAIDGTPSISITDTILNPATAPASITTSAVDGSLLFSVGLMKNSNAIQAGSTGATPTSLTITAVSPLNYGPAQFAKQNFGGAVYTGTITGGANNALVGNVFTVTGFTNALNNGTFTATASSATTLTLSNGNAIAQTGATAHAAYSPLMTQIGNGKLVNSEAHYMIEYGLVPAGGAGTYNPGFQNPLGYPVIVASLAIKSS